MQTCECERCGGNCAGKVYRHRKCPRCENKKCLKLGPHLTGPPPKKPKRNAGSRQPPLQKKAELNAAQVPPISAPPKDAAPTPQPSRVPPSKDSSKTGCRNDNSTSNAVDPPPKPAKSKSKSKNFGINAAPKPPIIAQPANISQPAEDPNEAIVQAILEHIKELGFANWGNTEFNLADDPNGFRLKVRAFVDTGIELKTRGNSVSGVSGVSGVDCVAGAPSDFVVLYHWTTPNAVVSIRQGGLTAPGERGGATEHGNFFGSGEQQQPTPLHNMLLAHAGVYTADNPGGFIQYGSRLIICIGLLGHQARVVGTHIMKSFTSDKTPANTDAFYQQELRTRQESGKHQECVQAKADTVIVPLQ